MAIDKGFTYICCGHIHTPEIKTFSKENGSITYLNSGDWVEHNSSLEYYDSKWHLLHNIDEETWKDQMEDLDVVEKPYELMNSFMRELSQH